MKRSKILQDNMDKLKKVSDRIKVIKKFIGASNNCRDVVALKKVIQKYDKFLVKNIKTKEGKYHKPMQTEFYGLLVKKSFLMGCIVTEKRINSED